MKLFQVLLINVVTVVAALVIYDRLRFEEFRPSQERASVARPSVADSAEFERRLLALEIDRRASMRDEDSDPAVFDRPEEFEAAVGEHAAGDGPRTEQEASDETTATDDESFSPAEPEYVPTQADIRRFQRLQEAVRQEKSIERNRARVDTALDKLPIRLTKTQRRRIHVAYAAFEPRVAEIWVEVKAEAQATVAAGGTVDRGEIVASTTAVIQSEFATTLTDIVDHAADTETIAETLMPGRK